MIYMTSSPIDLNEPRMDGSLPILMIDLEATCANDGSLPPEAMEIIEIGGVWATPEGLLLDRFQVFVRPLINPTLTPFCSALTGIEQDDVSAAELFPVAAAALHEFAARRGGEGVIWMSWGAYDLKQIERECARHAISEPLRLPHRNAKQLFARHQHLKKPTDLAGACQLAGIKLEGSYHRALDDAMNTARLLPWVLGRRHIDAR
jgi:inhibitor of KinA sporulation pathway (predicted exonuclease)